jgi:hypothetical protein
VASAPARLEQFAMSPAPAKTGSPLYEVAFTVHVRVAGVASVLPAASVDFTSKVWVPLARLLYVLLVAVRLATQLPPSNLVWKVAFEGSLDEKLKDVSA